MKSEAAKGLVRISSNYVRLGVNLVMGLIFLPFMLSWLGNEPVGLIGLLGASTGVGAMFREISDRTVVRELGAAHHSGDERRFRAVFNAAMVLSAGLAGIVVLVFATLLLVVPLLNIDESLHRPARVMVVTQALFNVLLTALSPIFNMQVIGEQFIRYNLWTIADRSSVLVAALVVRYLMHTTGPGEALIAWSVVVMAIQIGAMAVPFILLLRSDPRLRPRLSLASGQEVRTLFGTAKWYLGFTVSENLYERAGTILSNLFLGLHANTIFYVAANFISYITQAAMGITQGLDAVSARLESKGGRSLKALVFHSTRLLGLASIPVGLACFILAPDLLQLWIGKTIEDPKTNLPLVALNVRIMCLPAVVRSLGLGWTSILYGAGFLRRYASMVLIAAMMNPILIVAALLLWPRVETVSAVFAAVYTTIYLVLLPRRGAPCLQVRVRDLFTPLLRPILAATLCAPALLLGPLLLSNLALAWRVLGTGAMFGAVYALATASIVLTPEERARFLWSPVRRLVGRAGHAAP